MTGALVQQRCFHHPQREAAYRCPNCQRHYCRECGAEHDGRMLCTTCLKKMAGPGEARTGFLLRAIAAASPMMGLLLAWMVFYYIGELLLLLPTEFYGRRP